MDALLRATEASRTLDDEEDLIRRRLESAFGLAAAVGNSHAADHVESPSHGSSEDSGEYRVGDGLHGSALQASSPQPASSSWPISLLWESQSLVSVGVSDASSSHLRMHQNWVQQRGIRRRKLQRMPLQLQLHLQVSLFILCFLTFTTY